MLSSIARGAERIKSLAQSLLAFSRPSHEDAGPPRPERASIERSLELCHYQILKGGVRLEKSLAPDLPRVLGVSNQLEMALINLIVNAVHAMEGTGGKLTVSSALKGSEVEIAVSDDGPWHPRADPAHRVRALRDHEAGGKGDRPRALDRAHDRRAPPGQDRLQDRARRGHHLPHPAPRHELTAIPPMLESAVSGPEPRPPSASVSALVLVAVAYFVAAKLGLRLAYLNPSATAVWPPTGIALGALLVHGYRLWPAVFAAAFLANVTTAGSVATSAGIAVGNTAEALVGAWLVNRFASGRHVMERSQDVFKFALLAAGASTTLSATLGVATLSAGGFVEPGTHRAVWVTWWLGDLAGDLIVAPLVVLWSADWRLRWSPLQAGEAAAILFALVTAGLVVFGGVVPPYPVTFLCLPLLLWPAFRFGPREAASSAVVLAAIAVGGTLQGFGSFARESANESLLLLQSFLGVSTLTAAAVAGVVAERRRLEARLSYQADYDSLTEVLSRRRFKEELALQLAKARRYDTPAALLFVDLDDFKSVNDRLGHAAGDTVLASLARLLRGRLRDSDLLARLGGDEFAILLPRADGSQAETVAGQLLTAIGSHLPVVAGNVVEIAASIGIALIPEHGSSAEELLAHADAAMFRAKAAGRNRWQVYAPDLGDPRTAG